MTEENDPADLEPIRWEVRTEDGGTVTIEVPWKAEADLLDLLTKRHRLRIAARLEKAGLVGHG